MTGDSRTWLATAKAAMMVASAAPAAGPVPPAVAQNSAAPEVIPQAGDGIMSL